jgi:hypothetical protein
LCFLTARPDKGSTDQTRAYSTLTILSSSIYEAGGMSHVTLPKIRALEVEAPAGFDSLLFDASGRTSLNSLPKDVITRRSHAVSALEADDAKIQVYEYPARRSSRAVA